VKEVHVEHVFTSFVSEVCVLHYPSDFILYIYIYLLLSRFHLFYDFNICMALIWPLMCQCMSILHITFAVDLRKLVFLHKLNIHAVSTVNIVFCYRCF